LIQGDLTQPRTLGPALTKADTVICTATAMPSASASNNLDTVDHRGVQSLIAAAEERGVRHFIYVSYDSTGGTYPLALAKRAAEQRLKASALNWTILQPTCFCEVWFSPLVGFDAAVGRARIYGEGDKPLHYIAVDDVAQAVVACMNNIAAHRKVFRFGGGTPASQLDAVRLWEQATGKTFDCERMSLAEIQAAQAATTDPLRLSFLGLCELAAKGAEVDRDAQTALGLQPQQLETWIRAAASNVTARGAEGGV
jgi:uncharacterized protein YbjT (DUF2867 family)